MPEQQIIALTCLFDALVSSIDPSGCALKRGYEALRAGLALADGAGAKSEAAGIIHQFLVQVDGIETAFESNQNRIQEN